MEELVTKNWFRSESEVTNTKLLSPVKSITKCTAKIWENISGIWRMMQPDINPSVEITLNCQTLDEELKVALESIPLTCDSHDKLPEEIVANIHDGNIHYEMFNYLRGKRNKECNIIKEVSKALRILRRGTIGGNTRDLLLAERGLLLSTERCKASMFYMAYGYLLTTDPSESIRTLKISKICFSLKSGYGKIPNTFFVCLLQSGVNVYATKYVQLEDGSEGEQFLTFDDHLVFDTLKQDFRIDVKVYYMQLNFSRVGGLFRKKTVTQPVKVHRYRNLLTASSEEHTFLHPAFKQCGVFEISMMNINSKKISNIFPDSPLSKDADITMTLYHEEEHE